ncbi:MAG: hypothetical protein ACRDRT_04795 [Pseudonocardiaceae bacterium]
MKGNAPTVELWVDDHQEYEPGIVTGNLRHARLPLDPHEGDYLVVGDDEVPPALALALSREGDGTLRLRILPGRPDSHAEFRTRHIPTLA